MPQPENLNHIMLIEDEQDIRTVASMALEMIGHYQVTCCESGMHAIEVAEAVTPDIILIDMMMPEMDGISTVEKLREIPTIKSTPIIFMTAKIQDHEIAEYKKLGAIAVIAKPFNPRELPSKIQEIWNSMPR